MVFYQFLVGFLGMGPHVSAKCSSSRRGREPYLESSPLLLDNFKGNKHKLNIKAKMPADTEALGHFDSPCVMLTERW